MVRQGHSRKRRNSGHFFFFYKDGTSFLTVFFFLNAFLHFLRPLFHMEGLEKDAGVDLITEVESAMTVCFRTIWRH